MSNPHLIEDLKYDLRIYVFVYGLNPMRIFIHEQGLARFATEPYEKPKMSNYDKIMDEIKDIIVKTVIVGQPYMDHIYRVC